MFDPDRDDDSSHRFLRRLLVLALLTLALGGVVLPTVSQFTVGLDQTPCVALLDGWHADHGPNAADRAVNSEFIGPNLTPQKQQAIARSTKRFEWLTGPGACVPQSRHRLILSGVGLAVVALLTTGVSIGRKLMRRTTSHSRTARGYSAAQVDTSQAAHA